MSEANPVYLKFRERALRWQDPQAPLGSPSGVIVETGYPEGVVSLVVMSDGTVSLFFSGGGAVLHAGLFDGPAQAARDLAMAAMHFAPQMQPALDLAMPKKGMVNIFVLVDGIVRSAHGKMSDFGDNRLPLSPLFQVAMNVIAAIRALPPEATRPKSA
ncbi:MAG: hypothetical protein NW206_01810 [Hyphomonadaceae bacterium]|nr:hypothetical protein [Hyphomonadaceae bacterium]